MTHHIFCRDISLQSNDPLAGTGMHPQHNLLLSWPMAKWERSLRIARDMSGKITQQLNELAESGRRVNLIDREAQTDLVHQAFLFPEKKAYSIPNQELELFLNALLQHHSLDDWLQGNTTKPIVLCCTHGKKDKCCAKFGYQTYRAMRTFIDQNPINIDVWKSSHLGGCRFAASVLTFPEVHKYGRLSSDQLPDFFKSVLNHAIYLPAYRGHAMLSSKEQCAEVNLRQWLQNQHFDLDHASISVSSSDSSSVKLVWQTTYQQGTALAEVSETPIQRIDTCQDSELTGRVQTKKVWTLTRLNVSITPTSAIEVTDK